MKKNILIVIFLVLCILCVFTAEVVAEESTQITSEMPKLESLVATGSSGTISHLFDYDLLDQTLIVNSDMVTLYFTASNSIIKINDVVKSSETFNVSSGDVTLKVEIISNDEATRKTTYNIRLTKDRNSLSLSDLQFNGSQIIGFDKETMLYDLGRLPYDSNWSVSGTPEIGTSTVTYALNDGPYNSTLDFNTYNPVASSQNTIKIRVTNTDGGAQYYKIYFVRDNGVDLSSLNLIKLINSVEQPADTYSEPASTINYSVNYDVTSFKLVPSNEATGASYQYKIGNNDYDSNATKALETGLNTILVKVTQGTEGQVDYSSRVYTINVTRHGSADVSNIVLILFDGSSMKSLYSSYAFNKNTHTYDVVISNNMTTLEMRIDRLDSGAVITATSDISSLVVGANAVETKELTPGNYSVTINATTGTQGEAGFAKETYVYNIKVVDGTALSEIYLKAGCNDILSFDPATLTYNVEAVAGTKELKFKAVRNNPTYTNMTLTYDGNTDEVYDDGTEKTITFNTPEQIVLKVKSSIDEIKAYTINVTERPPDTDSTLSALSVSGYGISPSFSTGTTSYSLNVANGVSSVVVNASKNSQYSTMTIAGDSVTSKSISLGVGSNNVPIAVTAENGTTTAYDLSIVRAEASSNIISTKSRSKSKSKRKSTSNSVDNAVTIAEYKKGDSTPIIVKQEKVEITFNGEDFKELKNKTVQAKIKEVDKNKLQLSDDLEQKIGDLPVYDISVFVDGEKTQFKSKTPIVIEIPIKGKYKKHKVVAVYIDENDEIQIMEGIVVNGVMRFKTNHLSNYALMYVDITFDDVLEHWGKEAIEMLASREIVNGRSETEFTPEGVITRAEFVTLMVRYFNLKADGTDVGYTDIEEDNWYTEKIWIARENGILPEIFGKSFEPDRAISREDMMYMLYKSLEVSERLDELTDNGDRLADFADNGEVSSYAVGAIEYLINRGIINGSGDDKLNPNATSTRAEVAQMLYNLITMLYNK